VTNYRFYILNREDHITHVRVAEWGGGEVERRAFSLLAEHQGAASVEVWERDKLVYRTERGNA
jgi:hypothetical protein